MCKYRLVMSTDHEGYDNGIVSRLEKNHSLTGTIPYLDKLGIGSHLTFIYDNDPAHCMQTSSLREISYDKNVVKAVTRNSIYIFHKVEE